jgi:hypothetical protein
MPTNDYTDLIAGHHVGKARYTSWVFTLTEPLRIARERLAAMREDFDVDTAIGAQLDAVGVRVGVSRNLPMTLTDVYFALDDVDGIGLDLGVWKGVYDPVDGTTTLGDETYRAVIKAKIAQNHWDGTRGSLPDFLGEVLGQFGQPAKVLDLEDLDTMHVVLHLTKDTTPPIVWELFSRRIIDVTAAGVSVDLVDNNPWFGFDYETASVKGLDESEWFPFEEVLG